jgi:hypothetical protein
VVVIIGNSIGIIGSTKNLMTMLTPEFNYRIQGNMGMTPCIGYSFGGIIVAIIFPRGNLELNN